MSEVFKLPGSSYEELIKIIRAYSAASKNGSPVSLAELAQSTGMDKTIISRNNAFLMQIKLVSEGNKKIPTELCVKLGRAYQLNMEDEIQDNWSSIVSQEDFLTRMISVVEIRGEMAKSDLVNHIVYSSSNNGSNNARAGAAAIIEILKITQKIVEHDGKIKVGNTLIKKKVVDKGTLHTDTVEKSENTRSSKEKHVEFPEEGYYVQTYICESGMPAKFVIPENATEDDLLAFYDMLNIVLKRKFKIKTTE